MCVYFVVCVAVVCSLFIFAPFLSLHNIISLLSAAHKLCVVFSVHIPNKIMCLRICSFRSVVAAFDFGAAVSLRFPARSPPPPLSLCGACILHENPVCLAMMMMKKSQALFFEWKFGYMKKQKHAVKDERPIFGTEEKKKNRFASTFEKFVNSWCEFCGMIGSKRWRRQQ